MYKFFIVFLFSAHFCFGQTQNGILVKYKTISLLNIDSLRNDVNTDEAKMKGMIQMKKNFESIEYSLKIKDNKSFFEIIKKMGIGDKTNYVAMALEKQTFYVDKHEYLQEKEFSNQNFLIYDKPNNYDWVLSNESKQIQGFTCYKAKYKSNDKEGLSIVAWYTPEIPHSFGPKGYHGLPGLILEVIQNKLLVFTVAEIELDTDVLIIKPTQGKKMARDAYEAYVASITEQRMSLFKDN